MDKIETSYSCKAYVILAWFNWIAQGKQNSSNYLHSSYSLWRLFTNHGYSVHSILEQLKKESHSTVYDDNIIPREVETTKRKLKVLSFTYNMEMEVHFIDYIIIPVTIPDRLVLLLKSSRLFTYSILQVLFSIYFQQGPCFPYYI